MIHDMGSYGVMGFAMLQVVIALSTSAHVILTKRDTRARIAWVGLVILAPLVGSFLYFWLGVNRIERRARSLRSAYRHPETRECQEQCEAAAFDELFGADARHLRSLATLGSKVAKQPLLQGNHIVALIDGDEAFPAMLDAIEQAKESISLGTYIFDNDAVGQEFLKALKRAVSRNVEVRVLIDDVGSRYSLPTMLHSLRMAGIACSTFMPTIIPWKFLYSNLRTHRKTLVIDGKVGFTGGMNIRAGHRLSCHPRHPVRDIHFRVEGPVVAQFQELFADDWSFCTGELLEGPKWFPQIPQCGPVYARGVPDGPDESFESFRHLLLGAIASAESSIQIVTPYFLPDASLIVALNVAALRGISVDIVLPGKSNIPLVRWASMSHLWQVVDRGCRVWMSPPPFDHTKLMVVDDFVAIIGSSNWDPRSLRLNFEFNLECYDRQLSANLKTIIQDRIDCAHLVTLAELDGRRLGIKLRDGIAALASPYL